MGFIREEVTHEATGAELTVVERGSNETRDPWRFITMSFDTFNTLTPREMRELGRWLQQQGRRLGREYKSNGAPRAA